MPGSPLAARSMRQACWLRFALLLTAAAGAAASSGCRIGLFTAAVEGAGKRHERPAPRGLPEGAVLEAYASPDGTRLSLKYQVKVDRGNAPPASKNVAERWLNLDARDVAAALGAKRTGGAQPPVTSLRQNGVNVLRLSHAFAVDRVSGGPRWNLSKLQRLEPYWLPEESRARDGAMIGLHFPDVEACEEGRKAPREGLSAYVSRYSGGNAENFYDCLADWEYSRTVVCYRMNVPGSDPPTVVSLVLPNRNFRTIGGKAAQALWPVAAVGDVVTAPIQLVLVAIAFAHAMGNIH
jgi:hypothetical protein